MRWSCVVFHKCSTISFAVVQAANLCVYPRSVIVKSSISHFKELFCVKQTNPNINRIYNNVKYLHEKKEKQIYQQQGD